MLSSLLLPSKFYCWKNPSCFVRYSCVIHVRPDRLRLLCIMDYWCTALHSFCSRCILKYSEILIRFWSSFKRSNPIEAVSWAQFWLNRCLVSLEFGLHRTILAQIVCGDTHLVKFKCILTETGTLLWNECNYVWWFWWEDVVCCLYIQLALMMSCTMHHLAAKGLSIEAVRR